METDDSKENQNKEESANETTNNVPPTEENQKSSNNGPKTKTITVDLPIEEHVPCSITNEPQLVQLEVSFLVSEIKFNLFIGIRRHRKHNSNENIQIDSEREDSTRL